MKPFRHTRLCEKCNGQVGSNACEAHLKSEKHLLGEPDKSRKVCEKCNIEVGRQSWYEHLKRKKHLENDPDHIIEPVKPINFITSTRLCEKNAMYK